MTLALLLSGQGGQHPGIFDLSAWSILAPVVPGRTIVAGYSIGDLAAWGVAGRFSTPDVLGLAAARAEAMDAASGEGFGLAGIRGLRLDALAAMAERHGCALAIRNAGDSGVVGGPDGALRALCEEAIRTGAQRAVVLAVHTPSHTRFLAAASDAFRTRLAAIDLRRPSAQAPRLLSGLDGSVVFQAQAGLEKLALQIFRTIDWAACLEACGEYGADLVLELGPGRALTSMAQHTLPGAQVHALEDFHSIAGLLDWVRSPA